MNLPRRNDRSLIRIVALRIVPPTIPIRLPVSASSAGRSAYSDGIAEAFGERNLTWSVTSDAEWPQRFAHFAHNNRIKGEANRGEQEEQFVTEDAIGNPLGDLLHGALSEYEFGVLEHGFAPHGRDYRFVIQDSLCSDPGTYELVFTHVVDLKYETRVGDTVWQTSWTDEFTDYAKWKNSGEREGYVFGTDWSLAYPGIKIPASSRKAQEWSERLEHPMYSASIETDRFFISLVFSKVCHRKLSAETEVVRQVLIPLSPPDEKK
jgi:hypothetical protein